MNALARSLTPICLVIGVCGNTCGAPLLNLGFDDVDAYKVSDTTFGPRLTWSDLALPGWKLSATDAPPGQNWRMSVDEEFLPPTLYTTNINPQTAGVMVEGRNSLTVYSRYPALELLMSIAQTGDIPSAAKTLRFLNYGEALDVYVNGSLVPAVYRPREPAPVPSFDVFADVSGYSGRTVEIRFTTASRPNLGGVIRHGLDSIDFSADRVPDAVVAFASTEIRYGLFYGDLIGKPGLQTEVEASTDFREWNVAWRFTNFTGRALFSEAVTNELPRFYRVLQK